MNDNTNRRRVAVLASGAALVAAAAGGLVLAGPASANGTPARYLQLVKTNQAGKPLAGAQYRLDAHGAAILCPAGTWNKAIGAATTEDKKVVAVPDPTYALTEAQVQKLEDLLDSLGGDNYDWQQALVNVANGATSPLSDPTTEAQTVTDATNTYLGQLASVQKQLTAGYAQLAGVLDPAVDDASAYAAAVQAVVQAGQNATQDQINAALTDATAAKYSQAINAVDPILQKATTTVTNQAAIDAANQNNATVSAQAEKDYQATWASAGCTSIKTVTIDANGHVDMVAADGVPDGETSATEHGDGWNSQLDIYVNVPDGVSPAPHSFTITATETKAPTGYQLDPKPVTIKLSFNGQQPVFTISAADKAWSGATASSGTPRYAVTQQDAAVVHHPSTAGGGNQVTGGGARIDTGLGASAGISVNTAEITLTGLMGLAGLGLLAWAGMSLRRRAVISA